MSGLAGIDYPPNLDPSLAPLTDFTSIGASSMQIDVQPTGSTDANPSQADVDACVAAGQSTVYSGHARDSELEHSMSSTSQTGMSVPGDEGISTFFADNEHDGLVCAPDTSALYSYERVTESSSGQGRKRAAEGTIDSRLSKRDHQYNPQEQLVGRETDASLKSHRNYWSIIRTLEFTERKSRLAKIRKSSEGTSDWVFSTVPETKHDFPKWLQYDSGIFLIIGKAGSGKSTLLKHIVYHASCRKLLQEWSPVNGLRQKLITATFCFWRVGSALQNRKEGLYRSLLAQILEHHPALTPIALPKLWARDDQWDVESEQQAWDIDELEEALSRVLQSNTDARFCFFLDGLDEYMDELHELIQSLETLSKFPHVKVCITSRPSAILIQEFKERPRLTVEKFTKPDIKQYIKLELESLERFQHLRSKDIKRADRIIDDLLDQSRGIFLWVHLVMKRLVDELRYQGTLLDVEAKIKSFPDGLEALFKDIMDRIDPEDRIYMARLLFVLEGYKPGDSENRPKSIGWAYCLIEEHRNPSLAFESKAIPAQDFELTTDTLQDVDLSEYSATAEVRVKRWCHDLIESQDTPVVSHEIAARTGNDRKLVFTHRTVYDYVKKHRHVLAEYAGPEFEVSQTACRMSLLYLRKLLKAHVWYKEIYTPQDYGQLFYFIAGLLNEAGTLDMTSDKGRETCSVVLHSLNRMLSTQYQYGNRWPFFFTDLFDAAKPTYVPIDASTHKHWILMLAPVYGFFDFFRKECTQLKQQSPGTYAQISSYILRVILKMLCEDRFKNSSNSRWDFDRILDIVKDLVIGQKVDINSKLRYRTVSFACMFNPSGPCDRDEASGSEQVDVELSIWTESLASWKTYLSGRHQALNSLQYLRWRDRTFKTLRCFKDIGAKIQQSADLALCLARALVKKYPKRQRDQIASLDTDFRELLMLLEGLDIDTAPLNDRYENGKAQAKGGPNRGFDAPGRPDVCPGPSDDPVEDITGRLLHDLFISRVLPSRWS